MVNSDPTPLPFRQTADPTYLIRAFPNRAFPEPAFGGREAAIRALAARGFCALTARFLASSSG